MSAAVLTFNNLFSLSHCWLKAVTKLVILITDCEIEITSNESNQPLHTKNSLTYPHPLNLVSEIVILCSLGLFIGFLLSVPENKVNLIKVIRSILRENVRRNMRSEGTLERNCKERLVPLRRTLPTTATLGEYADRVQKPFCNRV